ncbi:hypothetical protein ACI7RC_23575 [Brevibacillus sp. B_LB10_24]|uniref:hypothetical protein n=1 Tax=Brevibacillus sp. B_LB10_24 TaxID=3380645 RepID=UPI0038B776A8
MLKLPVFLTCLSVIIFLFAAVVCVEMYTLERAIARGFYTDLLDDMQDIGYLDAELESYYKEKMNELEWEAAQGDYFAGTWPREESLRSRKQLHDLVHLSLGIRPTRLSQWMHYLFKGERVFTFTGSRPSEYFDPEW